MEKQIGLDPTKLEKIFAQIAEGNSSAVDAIYYAYKPLIGKYAQKFSIKFEQVQDIYNDVFCYICNNIEKGVLQPSELNDCFNHIMGKQCGEVEQSKTKFNSPLLSKSYEKNKKHQPLNEVHVAKENEFATQSLLFVLEFLNQIHENPELAEQYGLTDEKIDIIKDYYGINPEHQIYNVKQLAEKYQLTESRAKAVLVAGLKNLRSIKEFAPIKARLK